MLDLMKALALPVVVAARPGLGTLNHTLLTLRALRQQELRVLGVVLVSTRPGRWRAIEQSNLETIRRMGKVPVHRMAHRREQPGGRFSAKAIQDANAWIEAWRRATSWA
jgi:dethiobiotin synthetase